MIKKSTSLHKIPYFDILQKQLLSVDKDKEEYHDIMCVCPPTVANDTCIVEDRPRWAGYKFQFNYSIDPTMEPISYLLLLKLINICIIFTRCILPIILII